MTADNNEGRRRFLAGTVGAAGGLLLSGCDYLSWSGAFVRLVEGAQKLSGAAQHLVTSRTSLAQEFTEADLSPFFRSNGTSNPQDPAYQAMAQNGFAEYRLEVTGRVKRRTAFSLAGLRDLPSGTQITRHDCVEGWSAIGKWKGVKLAALLKRVHPLPDARYVVFHCADSIDDAGTRYYESIDMEDAYHPRTILAYGINNQPLPIKNGAPIRVRIERQLGYKMAKYVMRIELVESFAGISGGRGGYWEDEGYEWYAGI
ncbi:MAG: molybdopterin-dependent oxidoreductase [Gammaproteobacteria bacterium]|nr:molybdopterin-dependent oxidoreductase [Gammaproteobacteria bacterium]